MGFQNIKYGRLYLPRWTFSAHTFCCTSTNALAVSRKHGSHQCLHGLAALPAGMFLRYVILASRVFSQFPPLFVLQPPARQARPPSAPSLSQCGHSLSAGSIPLWDSESQNQLQGLSFVILWGSAWLLNMAVPCACPHLKGFSNASGCKSVA